MDEKDYFILYLLDDFMDFESLCFATSFSNYELLQRLYILKNNGYQIEKSNRDGQIFYHLSKEICKRSPFPRLSIPSDFFRAIYISDTHYGSTFDNIHMIEDVFNYAHVHDIHSIFHLGDLIEGTRYLDVTRIPSVMEQIFYTIENYPRDDSIQTYILFGNHDVYSIKEKGFNISKILFSSRPDFSYLGCEHAMFKLYGSCILLLHSFNDARVISRKQKHFDNLLLAVAGHFHKFRRTWHGNCFELQVGSLSDNLRLSRTGAYDITIPSDFSEILIRELTFDPDLSVSSEEVVKMKKKVL